MDGLDCLLSFLLLLFCPFVKDCFVLLIAATLYEIALVFRGMGFIGYPKGSWELGAGNCQLINARFILEP